MFCPECFAEYKPGFSECSDCKVSLIDRSPTPEEIADFQARMAGPIVEYREMVEITWTYNPMDIAILKSILDAEDIHYHLHGEQFSYARPWVQPTRLMVSADQADEVRELIKDLNLSIVAHVYNPEEEEEEGKT